MTLILKNTVKYAVIGLTATLLASCGGSASKNDQQKTAKKDTGFKLTYCLPNTFSEIEPGTISMTIDLIHSEQVYEGLIDFKKGSTEIDHRLAKSYDVSDDGLTYTFHLRHGVKFHKTDYFTPSRGFNADDVVFSFERQMDKNNQYYDPARYRFMSRTGVTEAIDNIKKVDDYTVAIKLKKPMATFIPNILAIHVFGIVSKEYYDKMAAEGKKEFVQRHPIGTGPWIFLNARDGEYTRYTANADYWNGKPKASGLILKALTDPSQYMNAVEKGECDITHKLQPADIKSLDKYKNIQLVKQNELRVYYTNVNTMKHKQYLNPLVMQAITYAINKDAIVNQVFDGRATKADSLIPKGMFAHLGEMFNQYSYDPKKAKALLKKAGYPNGKGLKELDFLVRAGNPVYRQTALLIQQDLKNIGITIKLQNLEWATMIKRIKDHQYGMSMLTWGADFPDPDNFYSNITDRKYIKNYWHKWEFDKLREKAQQISDPEKRLAIYKKMTKIFAHDMPYVPLVYSQAYYAVNKNLKGFYVGPMDVSDGFVTAYK